MQTARGSWAGTQVVGRSGGHGRATVCVHSPWPGSAGRVDRVAVPAAGCARGMIESCRGYIDPLPLLEVLNAT
ncbi:hypothetical protein FHR83_006841 [Actinoplanes campanulatus]|uniref:Uncharacterized protein n=1 Tax=Actinoplanes campanulatus TaxID=113559 RepID=A0A7W5AN01_9ACTN|nr:hypothetical protein [Actinoplanes campanulatus]MBB3099135.1 hypothetical protein [Actinoplanes campanulatus]GGN38865.1 hypothetical protein GCM10010109_66170 [Actinoplanes campanulatus]GID40292.1 hypothetical protein Aca09nite_67980 [Actinoplanes campanulatus]